MSICSIYVALDGMCTATETHTSFLFDGDNTGCGMCLKRDNVLDVWIALES